MDTPAQKKSEKKPISGCMAVFWPVFVLFCVFIIAQGYFFEQENPGFGYWWGIAWVMIIAVIYFAVKITDYYFKRIDDDVRKQKELRAKEERLNKKSVPISSGDDMEGVGNCLIGLLLLGLLFVIGVVIFAVVKWAFSYVF